MQALGPLVRDRRRARPRDHRGDRRRESIPMPGPPSSSSTTPPPNGPAITSAELIGAPLRQIVLPDAWPRVIGQLRRSATARSSTRRNCAPRITPARSTGSSFPRCRSSTSGETGISGAHRPRDHRAQGRRAAARDDPGSAGLAVRRDRRAADRRQRSRQCDDDQRSVATDAIGWSLLDTVGKPLARLVAAEARPGLAEMLTARRRSSADACGMRRLLQPSGPPAIGGLQITKVKSPNRQNYFRRETRNRRPVRRRCRGAPAARRSPGGRRQAAARGLQRAQGGARAALDGGQRPGLLHRRPGHPQASAAGRHLPAIGQRWIPGLLRTSRGGRRPGQGGD